MDEYIKKQDAINAAMKDISPIYTHDFNAGCARAANRIEVIPAADVVKVVRCSNCWKRGLDNCPMEFYWDGHPQEDDCFCKFGEVEKWMNKWEMDPYSGKIATWSTNVDEEIGFWQQYTYEFGKGNYSILHKCSICGFHPCDLNLGQYKFCPSCGRKMSAEPAPPIKIQVKHDEKT